MTLKPHETHPDELVANNLVRNKYFQFMVFHIFVIWAHLGSKFSNIYPYLNIFCSFLRFFREFSIYFIIFLLYLFGNVPINVLIFAPNELSFLKTLATY